MASPFDSEYDAIRNKIYSYADTYRIDRNIAVWQIWAESTFRPDANSGQAKGIAQFTPATAKRFGVNVADVDSSLNGWGKYMRFLLDLFGQNYSLALAGYNAGEGNVQKYKNQIPPFTETKNYVSKILTNAGTVAASAADPLQAIENFFGISGGSTDAALYIGGAILLFVVLDL